MAEEAEQNAPTPEAKAEEFYKEEPKAEGDAPSDEKTESESTPEPDTKVEAEEKVETKAEDKPESDKEAEPEEEEFVPLKAEDLKLDDSFGDVGKQVATDFTDLLNKHKLGPEVRDALLAHQAKLEAKGGEIRAAQWELQQEKEIEAVKADPQFAGDKLDASLSRVGEMLDHYGSPELREYFDVVGAGNNLELMRFMDNVSRDLTEGRMRSPGTKGGARPTQNEMLNEFFEQDK